MQLIDNNKPSATKWQRKKLDEISIIINGYSFSSQDFSPNNSIKSVKITNVGVGEFIHESSSLLPQEFSDKYNDSKVFKDDIVIALTRSIISSGLKVALVPNEYNEALLNQRVAAIKPDRNQMLGTFLFFYLSTQDVFDYVKKEANTLMQPNLSIKSLKSLLVPLPTLSEQKRIVSIVDEAFEAIDIAIDNTKQNLTNAREIFDSYLNDIFTQKENVSIVSIGDIGEVFDGSHATPATIDFGPIFLGISSLQNGSIKLDKTRHVSPEDFKKWTRRVEPRANDIVFSYETRLGEAAIIPEGLKCCLGRRMGLVRVDKTQVEPLYFLYLYMSTPFQKFLCEKIIRGATVDRISIKDFPSFPIPLPNLNEQRSIVYKVDILSMETQRLEAIYRQKIAALNELKQSILHKAFTGELTADTADLMTNIDREAIAV